MAPRIRVRVVREPESWGALLARVREPHITQAWAYGEAKQAAVGYSTQRNAVDAGGWRARRLVFERAGAPVAMCQLLDKSLLGVRPAARANRGPLFLGAPSPADVAETYRALADRRTHRSGVLVIAPALPDGAAGAAVLRAAGFRPRGVPGWSSFSLDLTLSEDDLLARMASDWRRQLRIAERAGLELLVSGSPEAVERTVAGHERNMAEKGFTSPPAALVRALAGAAPRDLVVFEALLAGEPVAGILVYRFGVGAEYYVGWMAPAARPARAARFLYWQAALELRRRGCRRLDLGGMRPGATEIIKKQMGGRAYTLLEEHVAY